MLDWLPWSHVSGACNQFATLMQRRQLLHRRRPAHAGPVRGVAAQHQGNSAELLHQRAVRLRDAGRCAGAGRGAAPSNSSASCASRCTAAPACRRRCTTASSGSRSRRSASASSSRRATAPPRPRRAACRSTFPTEAVGIGLPMPGMTLKLVPNGPRYEVRVRGQIVTPGYLVQPGGESRHLRRGRLLPHRRHGAAPRPGRHPEGTAVRGSPGRGLQARHRFLGRRRQAACRVPGSVRAVDRRRRGLRREPVVRRDARLAEGAAHAGTARPNCGRGCRRSMRVAARASASSGSSCSSNRRAPTSTKCRTRARSTSGSPSPAAPLTSSACTNECPAPTSSCRRARTSAATTDQRMRSVDDGHQRLCRSGHGRQSRHRRSASCGCCSSRAPRRCTSAAAIRPPRRTSSNSTRDVASRSSSTSRITTRWRARPRDMRRRQPGRQQRRPVHATRRCSAQPTCRSRGRKWK